MLSAQPVQKHLKFFINFIRITYYHIFPHFLLNGVIIGKILLKVKCEL